MASLSRCVVCDVASALPEDRSMSSARSVGKGRLGDQQATVVNNTHTHKLNNFVIYFHHEQQSFSLIA